MTEHSIPDLAAAAVVIGAHLSPARLAEVGPLIGSPVFRPGEPQGIAPECEPAAGFDPRWYVRDRAARPDTSLDGDPLTDDAAGRRDSPILAFGDRLRRGVESSEQLVRTLAEIADRNDPTFHAFAARDVEDAAASAAALDRELADGRDRGPLHGVPLAVKDNIDVEGYPTRAGSAATSSDAARADASVIGRLRAAGAILVGKTNLHEFALGAVNPDVRNAVDPERIAGGSSGGSAVAVARGMALGALGTETTASIRLPSAFNGVVGFKPTFGVVSTAGVIPTAWSFDTVGPIASTVADVAVIFAALAAPTPEDGGGAGPSGKALRIGVLPSLYAPETQPATASAVSVAAEIMAGNGFDVVTTSAPIVLRQALVTARTLIFSEAASYHARFEDTADEYSTGIRARIDLGNFYSARQYVDAQRVRSLIRQGIQEWFETEDLDAIMHPTVPFTAPLVGAATVELTTSQVDLLTYLIGECVPAVMTGQPAVSVPVTADADGMPIGMTLMGRPHHDHALLHMARILEHGTNDTTTKETF